MVTQNYCMVNETTSVCDNVCLWDGNPNTWQPPSGYLMLVQATTPAKDWVWDSAAKQWNLEVIGVGSIGFNWDGTYLVTNEPMPPVPVQPTVTGAQEL
jgi:hypothetical protein